MTSLTKEIFNNKSSQLIQEKRESFLKQEDIKTVLLLMGGTSSEREVSLNSGNCVKEALLALGYQVVLFDTAEGVEKLIEIIRQKKPDCVFNALHGGYGENGCMQALLNMMKVPYTHSGVLSSALAMNKHETKRLAEKFGIDVPKGCLVLGNFFKLKKDVFFDCVIKPNAEGSSVGVYILKRGDDIPESLKDTLNEKQSFLIEEYIEGREFSVAVTDEGALGIIEIIPNEGFYDYKHKYSDGLTTHTVPTDLLPEVKERLLESAYMMHKVLGCKGVSRSDFRYDAKSNRVVFLELNANPGMTKLSLVPEMALQKGISYKELVELLIKKADYEK